MVVSRCWKSKEDRGGRGWGSHVLGPLEKVNLEVETLALASGRAREAPGGRGQLRCDGDLP